MVPASSIWRERYGKVNEHNGWVPRNFWLEEREKEAIIGFHLKNPLEGYRRLTFMMLDADIVAVSFFCERMARAWVDIRGQRCRPTPRVAAIWRAGHRPYR